MTTRTSRLLSAPRGACALRGVRRAAGRTRRALPGGRFRSRAAGPSGTRSRWRPSSARSNATAISDPFDPGQEPPAEARSTLLRALLILPPQLRETVLAVGFHVSLSEAAEDMGVPLGTASTRIRTARAKLRKRL